MASYAATAATVTVAGAGLLARWSPTEWWIQIAAGTLPYLGPLALPASAAVGTVAALRRRPGGGVCAAALAAVFAGWALRSAPPARADADAPRLHVMTLNVGATLGRGGDVVDYIERLAPDVVVLQEAVSGSAPYSALAARLAITGAYTVQSDTAETGSIRRQVTLSRHPVVSYQTDYLGALEVHSGVYSRTTIRWNGREVDIFNVHLRPFNPTVGWSLERAVSPQVWAETPANLASFLAEQASEAMALGYLVEASDRPRIVLGDFNASPDQWSRALLTGRPGLREVTGRWTPAATRPADWPAVNVDGILVSADWGVVDTSVGPAGLSDHRPVSARLTLTASARP